MCFRIHNDKDLLNNRRYEVKNSKLDDLLEKKDHSKDSIFFFDGCEWKVRDLNCILNDKLENKEYIEKIRGYQGMRGPSGPPGEKGEKGDLGPRGPTGFSNSYHENKDNGTISLGTDNINGKSNVYIGINTGLNENSNENVYIGHNTGLQNSGGLNTFIGSEAGKFSHGTQNTYIGDSVCGFTGSDGSYNVFIGAECGFKNTSGLGNVFVGSVSGSSNTDGSWNIFLGQSSGQSNESGTNNIFIGTNSGISSVFGNSCICVGDGSDTSNETPVNQIVIGQGVVSYGDNTLTFPKNLRSFPNGTEVNFSSPGGGCLYPVSSSLRWKTNINDINNIINTEKIYDLRPITYNAVNDDKKETHIGLIAEEVDLLFPELVPKDEKGPASVKYSLLTVLLLSELKKLKQSYEKEIGELKTKLNIAGN